MVDLNFEIEKLEKYILKGDWERFEEKRESSDYDGASNYFGHDDDCFDAGTEYGMWLMSKTVLELLNKLKGD